MEPSIIYSIPYLFVAVLLGVLAVMHYYGNENVKRTTIIASFLLVLVFVGLRGLRVEFYSFTGLPSRTET